MNKKLRYLALMLLCIAFALRASLPAQGAKLTPDEIEKVHSRLFHKGPAGQIPDLLSKGTGVVQVPCVVPSDQRIGMSFSDELTVLAFKSNLVVVGKAETRKSHVNDDKSWLYSDWTFTVEVLKDNPAAPVQAGATILVTRPGGQLVINGRLVNANCTDFREFISGQEYLLFLSFFSETGAYMSGGTAAFALSSLHRLDQAHYPTVESVDKETLLKNCSGSYGQCSQSPPQLRRGGCASSEQLRAAASETFRPDEAL